MDNLLPRLNNIRLASRDPPKDLFGHLLWGTNTGAAERSREENNVEPGERRSSGNHTGLVNDDQVRKASKARRSSGNLSKTASSPLSLTNRGIISSQKHSHHNYHHQPPLSSTPAPKLTLSSSISASSSSRPIYMSLFNGVDGLDFDVYFSQGKEVHHTSLGPFATSLQRVCGGSSGKKNHNTNNNYQQQATKRGEVDKRIAQGFSVTAVSEATLELEQSDAEGRMIKADFGPEEVLGLDLCYDANISAVVVKEVKPGGQADRHGVIKAGDWVFAINDKPIKTLLDVQDILKAREEEAAKVTASTDGVEEGDGSRGTAVVASTAAEGEERFSTSRCAVASTEGVEGECGSTSRGLGPFSLQFVKARRKEKVDVRKRVLNIWQQAGGSHSSSGSSSSSRAGTGKGGEGRDDDGVRRGSLSGSVTDIGKGGKYPDGVKRSRGRGSKDGGCSSSPIFSSSCILSSSIDENDEEEGEDMLDREVGQEEQGQQQQRDDKEEDEEENLIQELEEEESDCLIQPKTLLARSSQDQNSCGKDDGVAEALAHLHTASSIAAAEGAARAVDDGLHHQEGGERVGLSPITIQFCNGAEQRLLVVYWIDYKGIRRYRNTLRPGEMYLEKSYASHPWLLRSILCPATHEQTPTTTAAAGGGGGLHSRRRESHAIILRLGQHAARNAQTFTSLWEPSRSSLSITPLARADVGRYGGTTTGTPANTTQARRAGDREKQGIAQRVRAMRGTLLQQLRDARTSDDYSIDLTSNLKKQEAAAAAAAAAGGMVGRGSSKKQREVRAAVVDAAEGVVGRGSSSTTTSGLPHVSIYLIDQNQRVKSILSRKQREKRVERIGPTRGNWPQAPR